MPKIKNNTIKSFFIFSSVENRLGETAKRLSFLARQAYVNRDFRLLKNLSDILLNFSSSSEDTGLFYQALYNSRTGSIDSKTFEYLVDSSDSAIRAASTLMLGGIAFRNNNYTEAQNLILKANKLALSNNICAPLIALNAQDSYSGVLSAQGAHAESLKVLKNNAALAEVIGFHFPATKAEFLNNCAFENLKLGNYDEASHLINKALSLPVMPYPEWLETKSDIDKNLVLKQSKNIFVPSCYNRQEILGNLRYFPKPNNCFQLGIKFYNRTHSVLDYYLYDNEESETRFIALIDTLDSLCVSRRTDVEIEGYLKSDKETLLKYQGFIKENDIDDLHIIIRNVKSYEAKYPVLRIYHREKANNLIHENSTDWLMTILEENVR